MCPQAERRVAREPGGVAIEGRQRWSRFEQRVVRFCPRVSSARRPAARANLGELPGRNAAVAKRRAAVKLDAAMTKPVAHVLSVAVVRLLGQLVPPAADATAKDPAAAAQALFDEGRRLMKQGEYPGACANLQESERIEPAAGTLMNLALCHERMGRKASAWAEFREALVRSESDGREDRVVEARRRMDELEPQLARLVVVYDGAPAADLAIRLDGTELAAASLGTTPLVVDPGSHEVTATAPGHRSWTARRNLSPREIAIVEIPELEAEPTVARAPPVSAPTRALRPTEASQQVVAARPPAAAWALGAGGLGAIAAGTYFGIQAAIKKSESQTFCRPAGCTAQGAALLSDANGDAWASDAALAVGAALVAGAVYWIWSSSRRSPAPVSWRLAPSAGVRSLALSAGASW
jgi:hypothetical protein